AAPPAASAMNSVMGTPGHSGFHTIPSATGGITRLACAQLREHGKDVAPILSKAGLTTAEVDDPTIRLEARAQIRMLELAAEALDDALRIRPCPRLRPSRDRTRLLHHGVLGAARRCARECGALQRHRQSRH